MCHPVWRQRRCQEDPVGLPSGRPEKTTGSSPHHMAQHHPTGSETSPSYAPRSSRFGSEPPSVEDDDVWRYAIVSCVPETTTTTTLCNINVCVCSVWYVWSWSVPVRQRCLHTSSVGLWSWQRLRRRQRRRCSSWLSSVFYTMFSMFLSRLVWGCAESIFLSV